LIHDADDADDADDAQREREREIEVMDSIVM
jgi:hypothetical protein